MHSDICTKTDSRNHTQLHIHIYMNSYTFRQSDPIKQNPSHKHINIHTDSFTHTEKHN
jgi:hypothetical protein